MTHDEADHGLTAWEIVNGARELYFAVGYGREPLYDYATALVMVETGPSIFALRLTSVYFSLLLIVAVYAWARRAFGLPTALLTAAGLAVGFWPVMAGRQALRSITLPAVFALAVLFFWQGSMAGTRARGGERKRGRSPFALLPFSTAPLLFFTVAGFLLGLTFYTYIPARVMWLAFPALTLYLSLWGQLATRPSRRHLWAGLGLTLVVGALVAAPLLLFLASNPGLEVRIDELSAPLRAAAGGDFTSLWGNARGALRLFTVEGDQTWRYNLPGKPWLGPVMGLLFYAGLLVAGWLAINRHGDTKTRAFSEILGFYRPTSSPGAFLALVWLALGFAPVLVTGPGLSMTQAIGALPMLYVFPALALASGYNELLKRTIGHKPQTTEKNTNGKLRMTEEDSALVTRRSSLVTTAAVGGLIAVAIFAAIAAQTARDYLGRWANAPEVRVQYETTMVTALRYMDERGGGATAVSTITPGQYHTPAVALLTLRASTIPPRWFDGRQSLILPNDPASTLVIPGFTPIPAALQPYLAGAELIKELPLRLDDLDRPVRIYALDGPASASGALATMTAAPARLGDHLELLGYHLATGGAHPGKTLEVITAWRLLRPLPDASLFAHLIGLGEPLAVADSLGAPGEAWVTGDVLLQWHAIAIPEGAPAGAYSLVVGAYTQSDRQRLATDRGEDAVILTTVTVSHE